MGLLDKFQGFIAKQEGRRIWCLHCRKEVSAMATRCPYCGKRPRV